MIRRAVLRIRPDLELDRRIAALALPALGAIAAEPAYTLADTAIVGHLGRTPLGALAIASTALTTTAWLAIFLSTATTSAVAGLAAARAADGAADRAGRSAGAAYLVAAAGGIVVAVRRGGDGALGRGTARRPPGRAGRRGRLPAGVRRGDSVPVPVLRRERPPDRAGRHAHAVAHRGQRQRAERRARGPAGLRPAPGPARLGLGHGHRPGRGGRLVRRRLAAGGRAAPAAGPRRGHRPAQGRAPAVGADDRARRGPADHHRDRGPARPGRARRPADRDAGLVPAGAAARRAGGARPGIRQLVARRRRPGPGAPGRAALPAAGPDRRDRARRGHGRPGLLGARPVHRRHRHPARRHGGPAGGGADPADGRAGLRAGRPHPRHLGLRGHAPRDDPRHRGLRPGGGAGARLPRAGPARDLGGPGPVARRPRRPARTPLAGPVRPASGVITLLILVFRAPSAPLRRSASGQSAWMAGTSSRACCGSAVAAVRCGRSSTAATAAAATTRPNAIQKARW